MTTQNSEYERVADEELRWYHAGALDASEELALIHRMISTEGSLERLSAPPPEVEPRLSERRRRRHEAMFGAGDRTTEVPGGWIELTRISLVHLRAAFQQLFGGAGMVGAGVATRNAASSGAGSHSNVGGVPQEMLWNGRRIGLNIAVEMNREPAAEDGKKQPRPRLVCHVYDLDRDPPELVGVRVRLRSDLFSSTVAETGDEGEARFEISIGREWLGAQTDEDIAAVFTIDLLDEAS